jgi:tellurite resistance protein TehA-like permease
MGLPPDAFAVAMATGVVSIDAADHDYRVISTALVILAAAAQLLLSIGLAVELLVRPRWAVRLARNPDVALRLFTFVAALAVLDARIRPPRPVHWMLAGLAVTAWVVIGGLAAVDLASRTATPLREQAHGAWLLASVATSGLGILAADLALRRRSPAWDWVAVGGAALALLIYLMVARLIVARVLAPRFQLSQLGPDSWILMGALAVVALLGGHIHAAAAGSGIAATPLLAVGRALLIGPLVLASAWIPVLLYAEMWRADHVVGALRYHHAWWSAVFPIGMYSAAAATCSQQLGVPAMRTVSLVLFWIAFTLWLLVGVGLAHRGVAQLRRRPHGSPHPT